MTFSRRKWILKKKNTTMTEDKIQGGSLCDLDSESLKLLGIISIGQ